ncbi:hypothetical protein J7355_16155 [Endozoicomonas sp. G2_2]|uniref:hypothetical protein n=1 Tax=Endozoicomonas sp. G2_2 TaxID=2821092 RepID=UPI001ADA01F7|nr:hypothetical protein [Endozoicomonas sp. G2_2]MBO9471623.1 hypothetical protein [Endozoicomonas sp. G2_2]
MASQSVSDRGHELTSWLDSQFARLDEDRQILIGRLVMILVAENLSHKADAVTQAARTPRDPMAVGAVQQHSELIAEIMRLEKRMNPPMGQEVDYLASTNAPVIAFFDLGRKMQADMPRSAASGALTDLTYSTQRPGQTPLDRAFKIIKTAVSRVTSEPTDGPHDNIGPGFLTREQAQGKLDARTQPPDPAATQGEQMLSAREMADYLTASHTTIYNRYKAGRIIGLSQEVGGVVFPRTQFAADGGPRGPTWLPGLDKVVAIHGNGWPAWLWLNSPRDAFDGESALDRLRAGDHVPVINALNREEDGAFG